MHIKLTNANTELYGQPIVLNTEFILTAYETTTVSSTGEVVTITNIYCPPHGTWMVTESLTAVLKLLNK